MTCRWPAGCTLRGNRDSGYCHKHWCKAWRNGHLRSGFTDPAPVATRIREHVARGGTIHELAAAAGVAHTNLTDILNAVRARCRVRVADRVLGVPLRPSNIGCTRRLHALAVLGHTLTVVAASAGLATTRLHKAHSGGRYVTDVAWAVSAAFDRLSGRPGLSPKMATTARNRGWAPPHAWYGIVIDDPAAVPRLGGARSASGCGPRGGRVAAGRRDVRRLDRTVARRGATQTRRGNAATQ